ncbi:MAG TPA: hypothetical protein VNC18_09760 [Gemmatimonadaceae bacterium]|nr:hypothetical protein [Gemmatimonadaceae bacterium]
MRPKRDEGLAIGSAQRLPRRLSKDATREDMIKAINELAIETQLCRLSIQDVGTKLGELSEHIRDALMTTTTTTVSKPSEDGEEPHQ